MATHAAPTRAPTPRDDSVALYAESVGEGDAVLLLHGLGSNVRDWDAQIEGLSDRFRVIAADLRGHGRSPRPNGAFSAKMFAADVVALLQSLGVERVHVCGVSMGGMVGFQLAVDHPSLVRSLAVINSGPAFPGRTLRGRLLILFRLLVIRMKGLPALGEIVSTKLFPKPEQASLRRQFADGFARNDRSCYERSLRAIGDFDLSARVGAIDCPILVVSSDRDYTPVSAKEAYMPLLKHARLVVIEDSGHASPMDQPETVNAALREFWNGA